jgi:hypothetical protein
MIVSLMLDLVALETRMHPIVNIELKLQEMLRRCSFNGFERISVVNACSPMAREEKDTD